MSKYQWAPRIRDYDRERKRFSLQRQPAQDNHPLKFAAIFVTDLKKPTKSATRSTASETFDPLRADEAEDALDPLSLLTLAEEAPLRTRGDSSVDAASRSGSLGEDSFEPWAAKQAAILAKFTTFEKLAIASSFFVDGEGGIDAERIVKEAPPPTVSEKVRHRLEQLDDFEDGSVQELQNLTQKEFVVHVDKLKTSMKDFWQKDQKVKALKITIQCSKMLADTSVIRFYPSKFALISEILDTFGGLVYDRILARSNQAHGTGSNKTVSRLPDDFTYELVANSAKEMCRNWFHKIASIRELVPRILCEASIVRCLNFIAPKEEIVKALSKLASLTRGVGDPLVSVYLKAFLCHVGVDVAFLLPSFLASGPDSARLPLCTLMLLPHVETCFRDSLLIYHQLSSPSVIALLKAQRVEASTYQSLFTPAFDWIVQCLCFNASEKQLVDIMEICSTKPSALVLNSILSSFPPFFIAKRALLFSSMIKQADDTVFHKPTLFKTFGLCLSMSVPAEKRAVLNDVWKSISKMRTPADYVSCVEVWIEFVANHFAAREINSVLNDAIVHLTPDRAFETFQAELLSCVSKILVHVKSVADLSALFASDKFLPFLDLLQKDGAKAEASKSLMAAFLRLQGPEPTTDAVLISTAMSLARTMHDSLNPLSLDDERNNSTQLVAAFINRASFGRDFEAQLAFYVQARSAFCNMPLVLQRLVHAVNSLAVATLRVVRGAHNKKTSAFVHACAAFCFITVPSLDCSATQMSLYLESAQVALINGCYGQAEALYKAAVLLLPSMASESDPAHAEETLTQTVNNLLSTSLLAPDNPQQGTILYLVSGLSDAVKSSDCLSDDFKCRFRVHLLCTLSAFAQETYAVRARGVDANDVMYGSAPKFLDHLSNLASSVVEEILHHLRELQTRVQSGGLRRIHGHSAALVGALLAHADLSDESMAGLFCNLWSLVGKTASAEPDWNWNLRKKAYLAGIKIKGYSKLLEKISTIE